MTSINAVTSLTVVDGIAFLAVDSPPVNALSGAVMDGLHEGVAKALDDPSVEAMVLLCEGRTFIAGADLKSLNDPNGQPKRPFSETQARLETAGKPLIAAIHGTALGGGLELAMGLHYRVAVASARFGLPEAKIGLLPAGGGTQRLPRLVGAVAALDLMTTGEQIDTAHAKRIGLIDEIVPDGELREGAGRFARRIVDERRPLKRIRDLDDKTAEDRRHPGLIAGYRAEHATRLRNLQAADAVISAVEAAIELPFEAGLAREMALFQTLINGAQNQALLHNFFSERQAAKIADLPRDAVAAPVKRVAVLGTGDAAAAVARACGGPGLSVATEPTADADLVILVPDTGSDQAAALLRRAEAACRPEAIVAIDSSSVDLAALAETSSRPETLIGLHFAHPADATRLIELVRTARTAPGAVATAMKFAGRLGKVAILTGPGPGLIRDRLAQVAREAAERLVADGIPRERIDRAAFAFGMASGPFGTDPSAGEASEDASALDPILFAMANEGASLLEQHRAQRASDIDIAAINGLGFPAYRGGPMFHADRVGLGHVLAGIEAAQAKGGPAPSALLSRLASEGKTFGKS